MNIPQKLQYVGKPHWGGGFSNLCFLNQHNSTSEMPQWPKLLHKPNYLVSAPEPHIKKGKNIHHAIPWLAHMHCGMRTTCLRLFFFLNKAVNDIQEKFTFI